MNSKFFFTLVGIIVAVFAICNINVSKTTEPFLPSMTAYRSLEVKPKNAPAYSLPNSMQGHLTDDRFISNPSMQSILAPRFANVNYGANIKYNTPDYENLASPCSPTTFGNMVEENYTNEGYCGECHSGKQGCGLQCSKGGVGSYTGGEPSMPAGYTAGDYQSEIDKVYQGGAQVVSDGILPVGTMQSIDADGQVTEPLVYSRLMYANQKSNLHAQGDFIRGDLPITPCNTGWFSVSVKPSIDLNRGAMNVLGGIDNETSKQLAGLIYEASGNTDTNIGGVNMTNQFVTMAGDQMSGMPVNVTAFP